ncbi:MAG: HAMP domain-containing sensor histidine kinase [Treponemataceae bacterium]
MRFRKEAVSWALAAAVFAIAALFGVYELRGRLYTNELIARNEAERTINLMLSIARSTRDTNDNRRFPLSMLPQREGPNPVDEVKDFISALESHVILKDRILGIAAYGSDGKVLFRYGSAPMELSAIPDKNALEGSPPRAYKFNGKKRTLRIQHPFPVFRSRPEMMERNRNAVKDTRTGAVLFYELKEDALLNRNMLATAAFIAWLLAAAASILLVRKTLHKNEIYRETLRGQRELVALGTAARTLAHEIKNPLSAIQLQADLIRRLSPGVAERELTGITDETARIRLLVDRIGDFLREPRGDPTPIRLADFASDALIHAGKDGQALPVRTEKNDTTVFADKFRLRSVIENIARNAFDSGSPSEAVEAQVREEGANALFEILDRGTGFPNGVDIERLFDPFFTTKTKGFGIGLALSRRFIEAAGGKLTLNSREGGGAIVQVTLPKAQA